MLHSKNYTHFTVGEATFTSAASARKCLPGDFVKVVGEGCELERRAEHPPLVGILHFVNKISYGFSSRGVPIYLFSPLNTAYPQMLVGSKERHAENQLAVARFETWEDTATFPRAALQEILGPCGSYEVEVRALAWRDSPWTWTSRVTPKTFAELPDARVSLVGRPTINIDPPGCRDIDDCVSLWKEEGVYKLAISIADVAMFMEANPALEYSQRIGQTLYLDGKAVRPMLPAVLSEGLLSLLPGHNRRAVSLFAIWDGGTLRDISWAQTTIRNCASYTYENCTTACREIPMDVLAAIAAHLLGVEKEEDPHKWIEALMLFYNEKAAEVLVREGRGLLRAHDAPDMERFQQLEALGLPAKELAFPAANYVALRSGEAEQPTHWGLGNKVYCHASSPIRRYADIVNQRVLIGLSGGLDGDLATTLNHLAKQAKGFERDCFFARMILSNTEHEVEGIVLGMSTKEKMEVYCPAWKRIVRVGLSAEEEQPGKKIRMKFYADMSQVRWKDRILYAQV